MMEGDVARLSSKWQYNSRYVSIFTKFFQNPLFGVVSDHGIKIFINQGFKDSNDYNLKNALISLMELSEVINEELDSELKLMIYLKRSEFESESKVLIKNLNWLGGVLLSNDREDLNKFNDWFIMEFEV